MSYVSGLAAASGISSALNASGSNSTENGNRGRVKDSAPEDTGLRIDSGVKRIVERVSKATGSSEPAPLQRSDSNLAPGSSRYAQFVEAVQALRLDKADAAELTPGRVAELKAAAEEVFQMRSDIPREQRPLEVFEEQRQREIEREAPVRNGPQQESETEAARAIGDATQEQPGQRSPTPEAENAVPELSVPAAVVAEAVPEVAPPAAAGIASDADAGTSSANTSADPVPATTYSEPTTAEPA